MFGPHYSSGIFSRRSHIGCAHRHSTCDPTAQALQLLYTYYSCLLDTVGAHILYMHSAVLEREIFSRLGGKV